MFTVGASNVAMYNDCLLYSKPVVTSCRWNSNYDFFIFIQIPYRDGRRETERSRVSFRSPDWSVYRFWWCEASSIQRDSESTYCKIQNVLKYTVEVWCVTIERVPYTKYVWFLVIIYNNFMNFQAAEMVH